MNNQLELSKEVCLGNLVWMQSPTSLQSTVFFGKKMFNAIGINDHEIMFLSANQFLGLASQGFSKSLLKSVRILMIGNLEGLTQNQVADFLKQLSFYKTLKHQFDVSLVLISQPTPEFSELICKKLSPSVFQIFEEGDPVSINEKIHDIIERASADTSKPIWSLSPKVADYLENIFLKKGEDQVRHLIYEAVKFAKTNKLATKDFD